VLALLWAGGHPPKVSDEVLAQIRALEGAFAFEMYFSLSCHNCPDVVQALTLLALHNPRVSATLIEGGSFPDEVEARGVMAVPATFLDGAMFASGKMSVEELLAKLDSGAAAKAAEKLAEKTPFEVLIVGGGPAGAAAAIYTARKGFRTGVAAERFGGQVLDTLGIENFISVPYTEGPQARARARGACRRERGRRDEPRRGGAADPGEARRGVPPGRAQERRDAVGARGGAGDGARAGATSGCRASSNTATAGSPTARTATGRCSRASAWR
jgi:alkyl hydroperoxide reductase subunit F